MKCSSIRTDQTVLGSTGCWCDVLTFVRVLQTRIKVISLYLIDDDELNHI